MFSINRRALYARWPAVSLSCTIHTAGCGWLSPVEGARVMGMAGLLVALEGRGGIVDAKLKATIE